LADDFSDPRREFRIDRSDLLVFWTEAVSIWRMNMCSPFGVILVFVGLDRRRFLTEAVFVSFSSPTLAIILALGLFSWFSALAFPASERVFSNFRQFCFLQEHNNNSLA